MIYFEYAETNELPGSKILRNNVIHLITAQNSIPRHSTQTNLRPQFVSTNVPSLFIIVVLKKLSENYHLFEEPCIASIYHVILTGSLG